MELVLIVPFATMMNSKIMQQKAFGPTCFGAPVHAAKVSGNNRVVARAAASQSSDDLGFTMMRRGVKEAASETVLSPRFYTTDFDETEEMFS